MKSYTSQVFSVKYKNASNYSRIVSQIFFNCIKIYPAVSTFSKNFQYLQFNFQFSINFFNKTSSKQKEHEINFNMTFIQLWCKVLRK